MYNDLDKKLKNVSIIKKCLCFVVLILCCSLLSSCSILNNYARPFQPRYFAFQSDYQPEHPTTHIKIISYNIKHAKKVDQAIRLFQEHKDLQNADIICLQEMDTKSVQQIADQLQYNYIYYPAVFHPFSKKDFGNAILSKWPILNDQKVILPIEHPNKFQNFNKLQRIAVGAQVLINDKKILVFSLHKDILLNPFQRATQVRKILASIPSDIEHVIVAGDFNTFMETSREITIQSFENAGFQTASKDIGWTYKQWYLFNKKATLDYIFIKKMELIDAGKAHNLDASDHLPIWAEIKFENSADSQMAQGHVLNKS